MGKINKNQDKLREKYKLTNWSAYNKSLKNRGKLRIWLSDDVKSSWLYTASQKPGGEIIYSDVCIEFCLTIKHLYGLAYRQTEGFIEDIFELCGIDLPVPSYSQIQRRSKTVKINIRVRKSTKAPIELVIDSTGLKVYGEGEWKVRKHGWNKHRTWKKLHMGSDGHNLEIIAAVLTGNEVDDAEAGKEIVEEVKELIELKSIAGDGAYDKEKFRKCIPIGVEQLIPPQKNAVLSKKQDPDLARRDDAIRRIAEIGREEWKKETGYHIRSKSEVNMFRYKKIFGGRMHARKTPYEEAEMNIKCKILNQFVEIGMPKSNKVVS